MTLQLGPRRDRLDHGVSAGWTTTKTILTSTEADFHLHAQLDAYEGEERVTSKSWTRTIPRDYI